MINILNQKPVELYKSINDFQNPLKPDESSITYADELGRQIKSQLVEPLFQPTSTSEVKITYNKNNVSQNDLLKTLMNIWVSKTYDVDNDKFLNELYARSLLHAKKEGQTIDTILVKEALDEQNLPEPSDRVIYSVKHDFIPSAKTLLSDTSRDDYHRQFLGTMGAYLQGSNLNEFKVIVCENQDVFKQMRQTMDQYQPNLFNKMTLDDYFEPVILPPEDKMHPFAEQSINRIIDYAASVTTNTWTYPVNLSEHIMPTKLLILNLDEIAHANSKDLQKAFQKLKKNLNNKYLMRMISQKALTKVENIKKADEQIDSIEASQKNNGENERRERHTQLLKKPVSREQMIRQVMNIVKTGTTSQRTQNVYEVETESYNRPNRREPMNAEKPGLIKYTDFKYDIHIYLDTSGSISERNYQDAIYVLIALAKKMKVNIYFTSFSHIISETSMLKIENRSTNQIYDQFKKTPKVGGGTDFENVWHKIQRRKNRDEYSFIITDFGYNVNRNRRFTNEEVKNTFYIPISTTEREWKNIKKMCINFIKQMAHAGDEKITRRIIM